MLSASGVAPDEPLSAQFGVRDSIEASWTQVVDMLEFMSDATSVPILLDGATGTNLDLTAITPAQAGHYSVVVSNQVGTLRSREALLTILTAAA